MWVTATQISSAHEWLPVGPIMLRVDTIVAIADQHGHTVVYLQGIPGVFVAESPDTILERIRNAKPKP